MSWSGRAAATLAAARIHNWWPNVRVEYEGNMVLSGKAFQVDQEPNYNPFYRTKEQLQQDDAERTAKEKRFMARFRQSQAHDRAESAALMELKQKQQDEAERLAKGKRFAARFRQAGEHARARMNAALVLALEQKLISEGKLIPINRRSK